ncbi:MAG: hypothetical protein JST80_03485 [Bdellovibrionales bacterium]|nr:hypothetical protein [Bdellovibrionales bacterium]
MSASPASGNPALTLVEDLFQKIIGPFSATHIAPLLQEPDRLEDRVDLLVKTFNEYPSLIAPFQAFVKSQQRNEVEVSIEEQIRFLTTKNTRDWLIVNLFNSVLNVKELKLEKETGRLPGKTSELLKFANTARTIVGEESRYKDYAFTVGLMFDFVFYLQRTSYLNLGQTKFDEPINQAFTKSMEQVKILLALGKYKAKLSLEKLLPCIAIVRQLAHATLYVLKPGAGLDFYKRLSATKYNELMKLAYETETFGLHTGVISAYLAQSLQILDPLGEVMSIWGNQYMSFYTAKKDVHDLCALGYLGVCINEYGLKGKDFPGDAAKPGLTLPELKHLDFIITSGVKSEIKI